MRQKKADVMTQEVYDLKIAKKSEEYEKVKAEYLELTNEVQDSRRKFENVRYIYAFVTFRTIETARLFLKAYDEYRYHIALYRICPCFIS